MTGYSTQKTLIITVPNRKIIAGEYGAAYGHNKSHTEALMSLLSLNASATTWNVYTGDVIEINIRKSGVFGKHNQAELDRAIGYGLVLEAEYVG